MLDKAENLLSKICYIREDASYYLEKVVNEVSRKALNGELMRNLMLDLLDISNVSQGAFRLSNKYFNLLSTIQQTFEEIMPRANVK